MGELQIFLQRRRKLLTQLGAILILGTGAVLAVLPRADAHGAVSASSNPKSLLLSPAPVSSERFSAFYPTLHR